MKRLLWLLLFCASPWLAAQELMPEGDPERGRLLFAPCTACHDTRPQKFHGIGPNLHRIFGRRAGSAEDFEHYSPALRDAGFAWTPERLFAWLANPLGLFPGTTMMSRAIPDPQDRADLIAYLARVSLRND